MDHIAIDLDNVISATDTKIRQIILERYSIATRYKNVTCFDYDKCLPISREQASQVFSEFHHGHLLELIMVTGSRAALQKIWTKYKITIATSRPSYTQADTVKWLLLKGVAYNSLVFMNDKSKSIDSRYKWLIDDCWETARKVADQGVGVILFDHPWNRGYVHPLIERARGWKEVLEIIKL